MENSVTPQLETRIAMPIVWQVVCCCVLPRLGVFINTVVASYVAEFQPGLHLFTPEIHV